MCTVTFIPQGGDDFILTSNRDENRKRSPHGLTKTTIANQQLIFPRDTGAGGTWIVSSSRNQVVCLLNGAFERHQHQPPYRRSRGLMVLDYFEYPDTEAFLESYEFEGMEPFTMVVYDRGRLYDIRWDEALLHQQLLSPWDRHIWSSSTLYTSAMKEKREQWFANWEKDRTDFGLEAIHHLHRYGGEGDPENDYVMNRDGRVQTVSITHVIKNGESRRMVYHDLLRENKLQESL